MAVKAFAQITGFEPQTNGEIKLQCVASTIDGSHIALVTTDAIDPEIGALLINTAVRNAIQTYAENEWSVTFGILDTVLLLNGA